MPQVETEVPFSGFYETRHNLAVGNRALMEYGCDDPEHAKDEDRDCDYERCVSKATREELKALELDYCRAYVKAFSDLVGVPLEFKDMSSPREYNFTTDRIFALIDEGDVEALKEKVDGEKMREYVRRHFTSYDGFCSFYDNDYDAWLKAEKPWDHNQIGALLECHAEQVDDDWEEEVYEDAQGNF